MNSKNNPGKHAPGSQAGKTVPIQSEEASAADLTKPLVDDAAQTAVIAAEDAPTQAIPSVKPIQQETAVMAAAPASGSRQGAQAPVVEPIDAGFNMPQADEPKRRRGRNIKAFLITFVVLACVLLGVYAGVASMFSTKFLPNTRIGDFDVSMKTDEEVVQMLDTIPNDYAIDVTGGKFKMHATGKDVGMKIDSKGIVAAMHEQLNQWYWPWYILEPDHDLTSLIDTSFSESDCNAFVKTAVKKFNKKAKAPKNAYITYDEKQKSFEIVPEELGAQLSVAKAQKAVCEAVDVMAETAELGEEQLKQPKVKSTDKKIVKSAKMANGLVSAHLELTINGDVVDEIGNDTLSGFVKIGDDYEVTLSEEELGAWVDNLASSYTTIGMERNYTREDGKQVTVRGGSYGWEVDEASLSAQILEAIRAGENTQIAIPCIDEANVYAGPGQRDWGKRYVDVDLTEQHARFYGDNGKIIWEADCITGTPDGEHDTPQGVWYVIMKQSPSKLIGYLENGKVDYEADVTYWMPFMGNSVGFHDATWQPDFGGSMYAQGYGSHGCVNLSLSDAKSLYKLIEPNDVVVVHS